MPGPTPKVPSLTAKVVGSLGWIFTNMMAKNAILFVRMVVLWKIFREDAASVFGLNGMAWLAINGFSLLQDMGFANALIQRKTDIEKAISITWYANVAIRVAVYAAIYISAPLVAEHFEEPEVCSVLRIASLVVVIGSVGTANEALLRKNFQFKKLLFVDTLELMVQTVAQVILALLGFGVWSLVYGTIASETVRSICLWWLSPIRVGKFDVRVAKEMFGFGMHMSLSTILLWLIQNMDYYFVGKCLGKAALGFYTLAFRLSHMLATNVARMFGAVLFPAFSEIGDDPGRVRGAWLRSVRYSMAVLLPMGVGLIVFSGEVVASFFDPKCSVVVAPMAILTIFALCRGIGVPLGDVQKGIGRPDILTSVALCHVLLLGPALLLLTAAVGPAFEAVLGLGGLDRLETSLAMEVLWPWVLRLGLVGAGIANSSVAVLIIGLSLHLTAREVGFTARQVFEALKPPLAAGTAMAACGWLSRQALASLAPDAPSLLALVILGALATLVYFAVLWLRFPEVPSELRRLLKRKAAAIEGS